MLSLLPIPFAFVTVAALIWVDERTPAGSARNVRWVMLWKPLSTLLVILVAALSFTLPAGSHDGVYSALILLGLALSLAGDVLLIFHSSKAFLLGLIAFLCAHLAYMAAFLYLQASRGFGANWGGECVAAAILALIGLLMYQYLAPKLGKLRVPVILYIVVISFMVHRALSLLLVYPGTPLQPALIVAGACLFYLSDAILAIDRFALAGRMPHGHLWNLSAYYAGQLLIALSASFLMLS